jgi:hypothetical protein
MQRQSSEPKPAISEGKPAKTVLFRSKMERVVAFIGRTIAPLHLKGTGKFSQSGQNRPKPATSVGRGLLCPPSKRQAERFVRAVSV